MAPAAKSLVTDTLVYFVHGLNNVILVSVLLLDISIKSGGYSESFFNPAASLFLN